ncbi:phospholipid scramblase family member 5-like isoform X1 [Euwallacea similis]|uniref:phospholipid scramblase family member 5-like isoform X1 n=1 Tax=Euwallacea similis TaxID=1736056 RepID=UPI00344F0693
MNRNNFKGYDNEAFPDLQEIPLPTYYEMHDINGGTTNSLSLDAEFESTSASRTTTSAASQNVVSSQPLMNNFNNSESDQLFSGNRRPIPISVIDGDNFGLSFHSPINGLDLMRNVDQLIIQQNSDLSDLLTNTENRYTVKIPTRENSEAIYYATESSDEYQRMCCGSARAFNMRLYDRTDQEAISFKRRLGCGYCTFCFHLQKLEVWVPPGELVGTIYQKWKPFQTVFEVCNRHEQVLYMIEGPSSFACFHKAEIFHIYTSDGSTQIGTIVHQWDPVSVRYQLLLQMPSSITDNRHKALLLGSAFLVEYMFFEGVQKKVCLGCCC